MTPTDDRGVHTHDYRVTGRCICGATAPCTCHEGRDAVARCPHHTLADYDAQTPEALYPADGYVDLRTRDLRDAYRRGAEHGWDEAMEAVTRHTIWSVTTPGRPHPPNPYRTVTTP